LCHFHTTNVHLLFVIPNIKWKIIKKIIWCRIGRMTIWFQVPSSRSTSNCLARDKSPLVYSLYALGHQYPNNNSAVP
jgi:hypothetical protein